ncbi:N-acetylmuramoyl-L-alanine amidase [Cohnella candidum]|uniref:AMIN domain-containing protein n=1 Tax=Cohnella candidum TaxID=2674991 RepID=A0A3G3JWN0_9BACL|nr:N-acetylmuramoyl-L-alanine amidase [Cohnella candidum]AYQ72653.1 AMIN domain-containing protein [Cohnella candidum]
MKKWISLLFVAVLVLCVNVGFTSAAAKSTSAATAVVPKLFLDGKALEAKAPPALVHASVLVPIRTVAENLGYKVGWETKTKLVTVEQGATKIQMTVNSQKATVNGKSITLTEAPVLQSDTTLIPLRFVGESLGLQVLWDNANKSVFLFTDSSQGTVNNSGGTGSNAGNGTGSGTGGDSGTETGNGTGTNGGSQPGSVPDDGGLIGVVDGPGGNGSGTVDGSVGSGTTNGSGNGNTGDTNGNGTSGPVAATALLHQIRYEPDALVVTYEGATAPTATVLSGPDRIVVDIPKADFASDFAAGTSPGVIPDFTVVNAAAPLSGQIAELPAIGHEALAKVRYSMYSDNPKTVRIVLDLSQPWGYELQNTASIGELRIQLKKPTTPVKSGYTVVLDAGHGGSDPGAGSVTGKWEKEFTLAVVLKVQAILASETKINLVLTRSGDTYPTLDDRVNLANSLNADLFLSVHGNSYTPSTNGTETYYTRANSLAFAKLLHKNAVAATGFKDNGVRTANYRVIKATTMPAALLEVGYLSNASNGKAMYDDEFQNRVAAAIAASIKQYFNLP